MSAENRKLTGRHIDVSLREKGRRDSRAHETQREKLAEDERAKDASVWIFHFSVLSVSPNGSFI